ncbi:MAG: YpdA family putative bacillithiol disulfide reductase [Bacteroidetes bacterium]|nr:YpdA family putative bacillithiol disulfide reductase [Bacteroidota bacterium]
MDNNLLDVLIVGAGPIGISCGLEAKKRGWNYLILEKGTLVNSLYNYPKGMQFFSSSDNLELDSIPFISNEAKPFRKEALQYYRIVAQSQDLDIHLFEAVTSITNTAQCLFHITSKKNRYSAKNVIIATGFFDFPNRIGVPGETLDHVSHYFDDPHYYANQKLVIVGANNSAVDAALSCYRSGAEVHLIIRGDEIGERVKYWVRPEIINRIEDGSIHAHYQSTIRRIEKGFVEVETNGMVTKLDTDFVLLMTGYRPDFDFLKSCGVTFREDAMQTPIVDPKTLETEVENLYLAGVVLGGLKTNAYFIDNSRTHSIQICDSIQLKGLL